jgi:PAS domain S-box-containing protein
MLSFMRDLLTLPATGLRTRWRWLESPIGRDDRERIAGQILHWLRWPLLVVLLIAQVVVWATLGFSEPTRFVPGWMLIAALVTARPVARHRGQSAGLSVLVFGTIATTTFAVLANSVQAPAYWANVLTLAAVVPLYGARGGLLLSLWVALSGAAWFFLQRMGWTLGLTQTNSLLVYLLLCGYMFCGVGLLSIPSYLLAAALRTSEQRRLEAQRAQQAEREIELAFGAVFERTATLAALLEGDGTVTRINRTGEEILRAETAALTGEKFWKLPWGGQTDQDVLMRALTQPLETTQRIEVSVTAEAGGNRALQLVITGVRDNQGKIRYWAVEGVDVTELLATQRDLAHARRLEALGQLAGGVAHDFNNMLTALQGAFESLNDVDLSEFEKHEAFDTMKQAILRASEVTHKLLAFGRRDRFEIRVFDVNQLVSDASRLLRRTLGAPIELVLELGAERAAIEGDEAALEHALLNLVVNARDAMRNGGRVTLRTHCEVVDQSFCALQHFAGGPGPYVVLSVKDTGTGMNEQVKAHVFEPFFTTKSVGEGSGLGLAAVHGTMLSHNGGVIVESAANSGTVIRLYFPSADGRAVTLKPQSTTRRVTRLHGTILVVDDEPLMLRVAKRHLNQLGLESVLVNDGQSALTLLQAGQIFDCIITDYLMPKMSGMALVGKIREFLPNVPIIIMTGYPSNSTAGLPATIGDFPCLRKPFNRQELAQALVPLLSHRAGNFTLSKHQ